MSARRIASADSGSLPWIDRWLAACGDLAELERTNPMLDAVIDEIDGRMIRVGEQWLADFASCNYLGFDLDPEIMAAIPSFVEKWGTHPSWSRLLGSPVLYEQIEERLTDLLGAEDALVLPTITLIHMSVLPVLAAGGTVLIDTRAHKTMFDGCQFAAARGATLRRFQMDDLDGLQAILEEDRSSRRIICLDGVNSMTGNISDLPTLAGIAREHDALLYVDDAHGFGVIGERSADESSATGAAETASSVTAARATSRWSSLPACRSRTRRSQPFSPVRPSSSACSRRPRRPICIPARRPSPRSPQCLRVWT